MIAAAFQGHARRRTEGGGMEVVVQQSAGRQPIECGCLNRAPEGTGAAESDVIDEDDYDIGRILGGVDVESRRRRGIPGVEFAVSWRDWLLHRQNGAIRRVLN